MKVTSVLPWLGAKRSMADRIVAELGPHRAYWEPLCGSMAVLLAKEESPHETVNDLHGDLVNLAWVLQSERWAELYDRCARSILNEGMFHAACKTCKNPHKNSPGPITDEALERAYWFFIRSWWGRNGVMGAKGIGDSLAVRFTPGGGHGGIRFRSVVDTMPAWHERLRSVVILNRDAFEVIEAIQDVDGVVIYVDPPYIEKGCEYVHDFKPEDHDRLARALRRFERARVVLSYYAHPLLASLYPEWTMVEHTVSKSLVNQGMRDKSGRKEAPEVLLINGPSLAATGSLF